MRLLAQGFVCGALCGCANGASVGRWDCVNLDGTPMPDSSTETIGRSTTHVYHERWWLIFEDGTALSYDSFSSETFFMDDEYGRISGRVYALMVRERSAGKLTLEDVSHSGPFYDCERSFNDLSCVSRYSDLDMSSTYEFTYTGPIEP